VIENTTHAFAKVESMKHGIENSNWEYVTENFNPQIIKKTDEWIRKILQE